MRGKIASSIVIPEQTLVIPSAARDLLLPPFSLDPDIPRLLQIVL